MSTATTTSQPRISLSTCTEGFLSAIYCLCDYKSTNSPSPSNARAWEQVAVACEAIAHSRGLKIRCKAGWDLLQSQGHDTYREIVREHGALIIATAMRILEKHADYTLSAEDEDAYARAEEAAHDNGMALHYATAKYRR